MSTTTDRPLILPDDEHNRRLVEQVHPPGWVNPTPAPRYNLVVIGAGTAGLVTAIGAAGLGAKVALVEKHLMGGDCLNVGCVPSKALIRASRATSDVRRAGRFGMRVPGDVEIDFAAVMERMRRLRAGISPNDSARRFAEHGVDVYFGAARFSGPDTIDVEGQTLRFKKAAICTGARAAAPPIPGLEEVGYLTNESVFELTELPRRLAVIGGGPIGCEMAQALARFGSQVTLLEAGPHVLSREDEDAAVIVERAMLLDGVELMAGSHAVSAARSDGGKVLTVETGDQRRGVAFDEILVGVGRAPNVEDLGLEAAGVVYDVRKGVTVNDRLQTTNRHIYAAGDVCSQYKFTHAADFLARIVIQNALFLGRRKASRLVIPWCTYTDPEVAHVGLSEKGAARRGIAVHTFKQELADVDRAILDGETEGFVKIHVAAGRDTIVGATIVARHAGEMISEIALAMTTGQGLKRLAGVIHPYPTQAEAIRKTGDAFNRTRLTPLVKALFARWLAWTR